MYVCMYIYTYIYIYIYIHISNKTMLSQLANAIHNYFISQVADDLRASLLFVLFLN